VAVCCCELSRVVVRVFYRFLYCYMFVYRYRYMYRYGHSYGYVYRYRCICDVAGYKRVDQPSVIVFFVSKKHGWVGT
jgi:hypothetical protein